jgi:hypothetical protein
LGDGVRRAPAATGVKATAFVRPRFFSNRRNWLLLRQYRPAVAQNFGSRDPGDRLAASERQARVPTKPSSAQLYAEMCRVCCILLRLFEPDRRGLAWIRQALARSRLKSREEADHGRRAIGRAIAATIGPRAGRVDGESPFRRLPGGRAMVKVGQCASVGR